MANVPANFSLNAASGNQQPVMVVTIAGVNDIFSNVTTVYKTARYGDAGLTYGESGLYYGGLTSWATATGNKVRDYIQLDKGSAIISQKIEPEQGRGSVTTFTLSFIDKGGYMTQLASPGILITELLGNEVNVFLGYQNTAYPDDYVRIFRGYVSDITVIPGTVQLQISDPGFKKYQNLFSDLTTTVFSNILSGDTTINVSNNVGFYNPVLNINAAYDSAITCYLQIDDEYMIYTGGNFGVNQFTNVTRGATLQGVSSVAAAHSAGATVTNFITIADTAMNIALKLMLSGWGTNWITGVDQESFVNMLDPMVGSITGGILLPTNIDANRDYGLTVGDLITVSDGTNTGLTGVITGFANAFGQSNRCIVTNGSFTSDTTGTSTLSFRSQYDSYPTVCGMVMTPKDVDVTQHQYIENNFLINSYFQYQFWIGASEDGKNFIETEVYLPIGCYAVTRQGRASVVYTKPPLGGQGVVTLNSSNILNPDQIRPFRSVNKRRFFNVISYSYDYDLTETFDTIVEYADSTSIALIKESDLDITSRGLRTSLGAGSLVQTQGTQLLNLFKRSTTQIDLNVMFSTAVQIEIGDAVILTDNGQLQISNFLTGQRNLGTQTFTVIGRQLMLQHQNTMGQLTLMTSQNVWFPTDRFAAIAPSSILSGASTINQLTITDSYGPKYPNQEYLKWQPYIGCRIWMHNASYSVSDTGGTFLGFAPGNNYQLNVSGFSNTPAAGYILEVLPYINSTQTSNQAVAKAANVYMNPTLTVVSGISSTQFTVSSGDAALVQKGINVIVHTSSYSTTSTEVAVASVSGTTVTVASSLGFTPSAGQLVDLVGFPDGGQPYRWI